MLKTRKNQDSTTHHHLYIHHHHMSTMALDGHTYQVDTYTSRHIVQHWEHRCICTSSTSLFREESPCHHSLFITSLGTSVDDRRSEQLPVVDCVLDNNAHATIKQCQFKKVEFSLYSHTLCTVMLEIKLQPLQYNHLVLMSTQFYLYISPIIQDTNTNRLVQFYKEKN